MPDSLFTHPFQRLYSVYFSWTLSKLVVARLHDCALVNPIEGHSLFEKLYPLKKSRQIPCVSLLKKSVC